MEKIPEIKYLVLLLNPEFPSYLDNSLVDKHDGEFFSDLLGAKDYAQDAIKHQICTRFVIAEFSFYGHLNRTRLHTVETFGFKNDKKNSNQLELFKNI